MATKGQQQKDAFTIIKRLLNGSRMIDGETQLVLTFVCLQTNGSYLFLMV